MRSGRSRLVLMVVAMALAGCTGARSKACEPCDNVDDCEVGLTCQLFGDDVRLCGDANPNMVCPPR